MDSRLINVFYDDPFDGNYANYNTGASFWSNESLMGMQLADSLDGILPIMDGDEANAIYDTSLVRDLDDGVMQKNTMVYSGFAGQQFERDDDIEILTVDPDAVDFDTEDDVSNDDDELFENNNFDEESQCSNGTFRTRTDSSSIGDYESHSSDYDDYDEHKEWPEENRSIKSSKTGSSSENNLPANDLLLNTEFKLPLVVKGRKQRSLSVNTNGSEIDGLDIAIDYNNFDLAEFITKDDFKIQTKSSLNSNSTVTPQSSQSIIAESDSDSDAIVDVETVEVEVPLLLEQQDTVADIDVEEDIAFVDNVKMDPSWSPKQTKKTEIIPKESLPTKAVTPATTSSPEKAGQEKSKRGICLVPSKKQCEILKRKIGSKSTSASSMVVANSKATKKAIPNKRKDSAIDRKKLQKPNISSKSRESKQGDKNLAMLQQQNVNCVSPPSSNGTDSVFQKEKSTTAIPNIPPPTTNVKRKLNLEEYKKRRAASLKAPQISTKHGPIDDVASPKVQSNCIGSTLPLVIALQKTSPSKHNSAITEIVQTLKAAVPHKPMTDPITEAKNKVLRMQQMKRAQQLKILDSTVSAKIPRVTKLPPLKDLVKGTYCLSPDKEAACTAPTKLHPDYEEIVIFSVSCNTDLSIPPINERAELAKCSSRSLLKSALLNISDKPKIRTSSLITSIQSEVVKKAQSTILTESTANVAKDVQHGEDKTIMYLPKNRDRKPTVSMGTQTKLLSEFPLLALLKRPTVRKSRERTRQKSRSYRKRNASRSTSVSSAVSGGDGGSMGSPIRCQLSGSECCSNASTDRMRNSDATAAGGYSSRSTRRHRSSVSSSSCSEQEGYERSRRPRRTSYKRRSKNYGRSDSITSTSSESDYAQSRARSRSPLYRRSRSSSRSRTQRNNYNSKSNHLRRGFVDRNVTPPAVEERRIVYVGRIEEETTKDMLRRKFLRYGTIKTISFHLKETGMKYGFVTFERAQDAFTAIDTSAKDAEINMYDIGFGGRRAFCRASYADLDNGGINNYHSYVYPKPSAPIKDDDSFEALLLEVKAKLNANKPSTVAVSAENTKECISEGKI